jgi:16S rRNA (uracil1498-N3)-methyltransferase
MGRMAECSMEPEASWRIPRLFFPGSITPGALLSLPDQAAHHAARVLRLGPGDTVRVFNGDGTEWDAQIVSSRKADVSVRVSDRHERDVEASLCVVLVQGISSRERMELTLQKAVELGVADIQPLETRRSVVRLRETRASRRVEHWQNLVIAACEQCGRNRVPVVHPIEALPDWLGAIGRSGAERRVMLAPGASQRLRDLAVPERVTLLAGPEGGLAPEEQELAIACGFQAVRLGPRILRTETAAMAAMAAMHALWGDF